MFFKSFNIDNQIQYLILYAYRDGHHVVEHRFADADSDFNLPITAQKFYNSTEECINIIEYFDIEKAKNLVADMNSAVDLDRMPADLQTASGLLFGTKLENGIDDEIINYLRENGFVIIYAEDDNTCKLNGVLEDQTNIRTSGILEVGENGFEPDVNDNIKQIQVTYHAPIRLGEQSFDRIPQWSFDTNLPHAEFEIQDGVNVYCKGLILRIEDLEK